MTEKTITVENSVGLYAKPGTLFVRCAEQFKSSISISKDGRTASAKSLLGVLSLAVNRGSVITLVASGPDEQEAVEALCSLIDSDFSTSETV